MKRVDISWGRAFAGLMGFLLTALSTVRAQTDTVNAGTNAPPDTAVITNDPAYFAPRPAASAANLPGSTAAAKGSQQDDIEDIRPPYFYLNTWFWLWVVLGVLVVLALLVLLWLWFRPQRQLSPKSAYALALEKLEKARAHLREDEPMPYAVMVSETIRSYLGQRFQTPSTRRTTEEFLRQMESDPTSHLAGHRELLRDFLHSCDLVKFARYQPTLRELEHVHDRAYGFVTATKPVSTPNQKNGVHA